VVHTALPQQRRQQRWRKWCSPAVLRSAAAAQCPAFVANICRGGVSPRRRGSASARSCCLDHVPARLQVAPCRRCRRPARRARLASRARQALGSHGKDATSAIDSPEPPTVRKGRGRGPRHPSMQWHGAEMSVSDRPSVATSLVRRVSGRRCCFLLRDRLMFVLRDGASPCAAAATPAPQRALLPCAPQKQQARPPWALSSLAGLVC